MANQNPEASKGAIVQAVTRQTTTEGTTGDNVILAAPGAGKLLCIKLLSVQNATETAAAAIIKEGDTDKFTMYNATQGSGIMLDLDPGFEWRLPVNTALYLALSADVNHYVNVWYWTEDV